MFIDALPTAKKVLVLAPHPDDESLGCGGTIALYSSSGADVHLAVVSNGENIEGECFKDIDISEVRRQEVMASSEILGIKDVRFLEFPDGQLSMCVDALEKKFETVINEISPDIVFAPSPVEHHDDHRAVSEAVMRFVTKGCTFKAAFYEVYGTVRFNTLIDISAVSAVKQRAIQNYHYSLFGQPQVYNEAIKGLNSFRAFYTGQSSYYEAFWLISSPLTPSDVFEWLTYGMNEKTIKALSCPEIADKINSLNQRLPDNICTAAKTPILKKIYNRILLFLKGSNV